MTVPLHVLKTERERDSEWFRQQLRELLDDPETDFSNAILLIPTQHVLLHQGLDPMREVGELEHAKFLIFDRMEHGAGWRDD